MTYTSPILQGVDTDEFLDVDFGSQASSDLLGYLPPSARDVEKLRDVIPRYSGEVYSRDEIRSLIRERDESGVWQYQRLRQRQQQREGQCVYAALAYALQIKFSTQFGDEWAIPLSANSGYKFNSRSANSGSYVGGAIEWAEAKGLVPSSDWPENLERKQRGEFDHVFGSTGNYTQSLPSGWENSAKLFRAHEWQWAGSVEEWWSSILNDCVAEGGRDSHAICTMGLAVDGNEIYDVYGQTWGEWGYTLNTVYGPLKSFGLDSESKVRTKVSRDGFILRTVIAPDFVTAG